MSRKLPFTFDVRCEADDSPAEIRIRGIIGPKIDKQTWTLTDTEEAVLNELDKIPKTKKINVRINSKGGDHGMSLGIHNAFKRRGNLDTHNEGYACSGAALVLCAGDKVFCPPESCTMFHQASCLDYGNKQDKAQVIEMLKTADETQAAVMSQRLGITKDEAQAMLEKGETWMSGDKAKEMGLCDDITGDIVPDEDEMDDADVSAEIAVLASYKHLPQPLKDLHSRLLVKAQAVNPPPTPQPPTKVKNMKEIINALVAAGYQIPADANEAAILPAVLALVTERTNLKTENQKFVEARKTRVTAAIEAAFTEKIIVEARKTSMLALGTSSEEGATEVLAQIAELREAKTQRPLRGAPPAPRAAGSGDTDTIESLLEEQAEAMKGTDGDLLASINARLAEKRGRKDLFKPSEERRAFNN